MNGVRNFGTWGMAGTAAVVHILGIALLKVFNLIFVSWSAIWLNIILTIALSLILSVFIAMITPRREKLSFYTATVFTILALYGLLYPILAWLFNSMGMGVVVSP